MHGSGHPTPATLETLVALSLMRLGTDTVVPRLFNDARASTADIERDLQAIASDVINRLGPGADARFCDARARGEGAVARARATGTEIVTILDPGYPDRLLNIPDPPIVLWTSGRAEVLVPPTVAVVGSRRATPTGLAVSRRLSQELAAAGVTVVSGLARGVDGAAHRGALAGAGGTVAVLGNGPDVAYPTEHRQLMAAIKAAGIVISEFPPGTRPEPRHFPLRNRIISGLSLAVVVVEASEKSGSLITARAALEQGRDVLAVPGSIASGTYRGCHGLIKDGARLVETVDDILDEIGRPCQPRGVTEADKSLHSKGLDGFIGGLEPVSVDELAHRTGRPAAECLADLTLLEVSGRIARTAGGGFVKLDGPATYITRLARLKRKGLKS